jgi:hypothetical protein
LIWSAKRKCHYTQQRRQRAIREIVEYADVSFLRLVQEGVLDFV